VSARYRFGPFELDSGAGTLSRKGERIKLQELPYRLLLMVVEQAGQIVSRDAVRQRLWPDNTFVEFDNSLGVAVRKIRDALGDDADSPRYIETIPRKGYRFLAPVTSISTEETRPLSDTPRAPVSVPPVPAPTTVSTSKKTNRYWTIGALGVVVIAAIFGVRFLRRNVVAKPEIPVPETHVRVRRSVAVIGFRNIPGRPEDAWLSAAFAEMLTTELAADGALRLVSGEDVAHARHELPFGDEDTLAKATLTRLRTDPGADVVVLGSYTPLPGKTEKRIRLDVRLQDTVRGETISEKAFVGNEADLFELVAQAGASLRESLGATPASDEVVAQARAALPNKPEAVKLYTEGLEQLWAFDFVKARDLLIQAAGVDPEFPLTHAALSDAWFHLGYVLKARAEAEMARSLSKHLGPEDQLQIEALYYSSIQDRNKTIDAYRKLFAKFPDSLDYGLRLGDEQRQVNASDALQTVAALRRLPAPASDDPRLDILEARSWMDRDLSKVQAAGRRAVEKGTAEGATLLVARAYGVLCQSLGEGVSTAQAVQDCESARRSYAAAGDRNDEARTLNDYAGLYYQLGDIDRAEKMFQEALAIFRKMGNIEGLTYVNGNLGDISLAKGNLDGAAHALLDTIPGYEEMGDKDGLALTLNDLGEVDRKRGDLKNALKNYEKAKAIAHEGDDKRALAYVLNGIGDVQLDQGDLAGARKSYDGALAIRQQMGAKQTTAETELALAHLALEEGHASDAETSLRKCKEQFHKDQQSDDELAAATALIEALVAQSKYADAANEVTATKSLAAKSANLYLHLELDLAAARLEGASGNMESAKAHLDKTLQSARSHKLLGVEFQTRLELFELKRRSEQGKSAGADLQALENAAHDKGFELIATKAHALRNAVAAKAS
jgi:DNA-binding winged helix-turn-helix (wHTH) protein/tetratricopeptide (TPR) repeat protein